MRAQPLFATPWNVAHQNPLSCPWDFLGKNTGVSFHLLLQGIFQTQGSNLGLLLAGGSFTISATWEA